MINLLLIILSLMTVVLLLLGIVTFNLKRQIDQLKRDDRIARAIRKYELEWGE